MCLNEFISAKQEEKKTFLGSVIKNLRCSAHFKTLLCRSLLTTFRVKGFMGLWWHWISLLTQRHLPKPWGSPATNTCCTGTCLRNWSHSLLHSGRRQPLQPLMNEAISEFIVLIYCCILSWIYQKVCQSLANVMSHLETLAFTVQSRTWRLFLLLLWLWIDFLMRGCPSEDWGR